MWLFNEDGFFSITTTEKGNPRKLDADGEHFVCVRSRDEDSLTALLNQAVQRGDPTDRGIVSQSLHGVGTDYSHRAILAKDELGRYLDDYANTRLTYRSFKDGMADRWSGRADHIQRLLTLQEVWWACRDHWPDSRDSL